MNALYLNEIVGLCWEATKDANKIDPWECTLQPKETSRLRASVDGFITDIRTPMKNRLNVEQLLRETQ